MRNKNNIIRSFLFCVMVVCGFGGCAVAQDDNERYEKEGFPLKITAEGFILEKATIKLLANIEPALKNPQRLRLMGAGKTYTASEFYKLVCEPSEAFGWVIIPDPSKENPVPVGFLGLKKTPDGKYDVGAIIVESASGKQYAERAIKAVVKRCPKVILTASAHPDNLASNAVLKKLGFQLITTQFNPKYNAMRHLYELHPDPAASLLISSRL